MEEMSTRVDKNSNDIEYKKLIRILNTQKVDYIKEKIFNDPNAVESLKNFIIGENEQGSQVIKAILSSERLKIIQQVIEITGDKSSTFVEKLKDFINNNDIDIVVKILSSQCPKFIEQLINEKDYNFIGKLKELVMGENKKVSKGIIKNLNTNSRRNKSKSTELTELINIAKGYKNRKKNPEDISKAVRKLPREHKEVECLEIDTENMCHQIQSTHSQSDEVVSKTPQQSIFTPSHDIRPTFGSEVQQLLPSPPQQQLPTAINSIPHQLLQSSQQQLHEQIESLSQAILEDGLSMYDHDKMDEEIRFYHNLSSMTEDFDEIYNDSFMNVTERRNMEKGLYYRR